MSCLLLVLFFLISSFYRISHRLVLHFPRGIDSTSSAQCSAPLEPNITESLALKHINPYIFSPPSLTPTLYVLLGGPGSGKGTVYSRNTISEFLLHGLDEYLVYHPDYPSLFKNPLFVYPQAADSCYPHIIPLAKRVRDLALTHRLSLVYEETGKDLVRLRDRVLAPFVAAGYKIVGILVDTSPDVAVLRARLRFLASGRFAAEAYIRASFPDAKSIEQLFAPHALVRCSNDCRHRPGPSLAKASMKDCLICNHLLP